MQRGPLLDVQFQVGRQIPGFSGRLTHPAHAALDVGQAGAHQDALVIHGGEVAGFQRAGHSPAAEQPAVKAGAFFVGEHQDFHRMPGSGVGIRQRLHDLNAAHHAQGAVVLAAVGHGVDMGAHRDGGQVGV